MKYVPYIRFFFNENKNPIGSTEEVLDSFTPKDNLSPLIWNPDNTLKKDILEDLLSIAQDFYKSLDVNAPIEDIQFTGSLANYNWSSFSDVDIHLVLSYNKINDNTNLVRNYMLAKKSLWNEKNDIEIHGFPMELYVQDTNDKPISSGVYSLIQDNWLIQPQSGQFHIDAPEVKKKAEDMIHEIDDVIQSNDINRADSFWDKLKQYRQAGLEKSGESSSENIVFKVLRRNGYIQKLSDFEDNYYQQAHTIL